MAKNDVKSVRKLETVRDDNTEYLRLSMISSLNSDPEVKATFRPAELGMKGSDGTLVIVMLNGGRYRLETRFVRVKTE